MLCRTSPFLSPYPKQTHPTWRDQNARYVHPSPTPTHSPSRVAQHSVGRRKQLPSFLPTSSSTASDFLYSYLPIGLTTQGSVMRWLICEVYKKGWFGYPVTLTILAYGLEISVLWENPVGSSKIKIKQNRCGAQQQQEGREQWVTVPVTSGSTKGSCSRHVFTRTHLSMG